MIVGQDMVRTFFLVALFISVSGRAAPIVTIGAGAESCGAWTANRAQGGWAAAQDEQWVLGFVSGHAVATGDDVLRRADAEGIWAETDNVCRRWPLKHIADAVQDVQVALYSLGRNP